MITNMAGTDENGMRICMSTYTCSDVSCVRCIVRVYCKIFQWPTTCIILQLGRYFFMQNSHSITFASEITHMGHMWAGISCPKPSQSQWYHLFGQELPSSSQTTSSFPTPGCIHSGSSLSSRSLMICSRITIAQWRSWNVDWNGGCSSRTTFGAGFLMHLLWFLLPHDHPTDLVS